MCVVWCVCVVVSVWCLCGVVCVWCLCGGVCVVSVWCGMCVVCVWCLCGVVCVCGVCSINWWRERCHTNQGYSLCNYWHCWPNHRTLHVGINLAITMNQNVLLAIFVCLSYAGKPAGWTTWRHFFVSKYSSEGRTQIYTLKNSATHKKSVNFWCSLFTELDTILSLSLLQLLSSNLCYWSYRSRSIVFGRQPKDAMKLTIAQQRGWQIMSWKTDRIVRSLWTFFLSLQSLWHA